MNDPDVKRIAIIGGAALLGLAILNQAYEAGVAAGLAHSGRGVGVYDGHGFFPFPPFLLIAGIVAFVIWRRRNGHGNGGPGRGFGPGRPPRLFEEWHRRPQEAGQEQPRPEAGVPAAPFPHVPPVTTAPPANPGQPTAGSTGSPTGPTTV